MSHNAIPTVNRWIPAGKSVTVLKVGTGNYRAHKLAKNLTVPAGFTVCEDSDQITFTVDGWKVTAFAEDVMTIRTRKLKAEGCCLRCGGRGIIPAYAHVQGGVCFKCGGSGFPGVLPAHAI